MTDDRGRTGSSGRISAVCDPSSDRIAPYGENYESRTHESFQPAGAGSGLRPDPDLDREPGEDSVLVLRRDQEAGDHQLPHLQARARRPVLRAHLRADQGLRVLVRQVQAHEVQGHHLREVLGRGHAFARAARAHGPYRARGAGRPHLVPQVAAVAHRASARHDAQDARAHPLFRELRRARAGIDPARGPPAPERGRVSQGAGAVRRRQLHRHDRRGSHPRDAQGARSRQDAGRSARGDRRVRIPTPRRRRSPSGSRSSRRSSSPATSRNG